MKSAAGARIDRTMRLLRFVWGFIACVSWGLWVVLLFRSAVPGQVRPAGSFLSWLALAGSFFFALHWMCECIRLLNLEVEVLRNQSAAAVHRDTRTPV